MPYLFGTAAFLGAFLLFSVQPMLARMVLPEFGGGPAVWNTCMVFFQAMLLAGYGYAHAAIAGLGARRQAALHLGRAGAGGRLLADGRRPLEAGDGSPSLRLLGRLLATAGLPFFAVAAVAPMLQRWFAATVPRDPYILYAASNAGSLLALVGYVALVEPNLTLRDQARLWAAGYAVLAGLIVACAVALWRAPGSSEAQEVTERPGVRERLRWAALAFVPSSLLLGVTTYLSTDLAPMPLLWVAPLTLYLLSFIVAFAGPPAWVRRACALAVPPAAVATLVLIVGPEGVPLWAMVAVHLATFFLVATACHTALAAGRPAPGRLTEFYLMLSLGGALGGLFNALVAPALFNWVAEYPLGLALAALLVPTVAHRRSRGRFARALDVVLPLGLGAVAYAAPAVWRGTYPGWLLLVPPFACLLFVRRPMRFALGLAVVAAVVVEDQDARRKVVLRERTFFGVLRVSADFPPGMNTLAHGNTVHGMQRRSPDRSVRRVPLMYYFPTGPIGDVFDAFQGTPVVERVGVVGLGAGSLAGYGRPGQEFAFFEVDPAVARIARDPAYFHFLGDCLARWRIVLGDARLTLGREPDGSFDLIVLDAFSGDAIPVHLLTREALRLYLDKLADGGLIALHISNAYLDLGPAIAALARDVGLAGLERQETSVPENELAQGRLPSHWVVLGRRPSDLSRLADRPGWRPLDDRRELPVWTDDYSDLIRLLKWR